MSKIITAVHRRSDDAAQDEPKILAVLKEITVDIVRSDARYEVRHAAGHVLGILDLSPISLLEGLNVCQGKLYDSHSSWSVPGTGHPDGSYAIVRSDNETLEVLSDPAGSRTVWYYFDDEVFVASNSQRAVTMYAGRFEANPTSRLWALSNGTPGPGQSYNRHLKLLPPASTLRLDRATWTLDSRRARRSAPRRQAVLVEGSHG
jgi:hypothetical protein